MSICPNVNLPEWKALESGVGKLEAYRDFLETNGEIRTPEQVNEKIAERNQGAGIQSPEHMLGEEIANSTVGPNAKVSIMGQAIITDTINNTVDPVDNDQVRAIEVAKKMSDMLDINYETVTAAEAQALTQNAGNPWKAGDIAFFIGGTVYFVGDHLSTENVFHEFSHPFVRHIAQTNNALFNKLYDQLAGTDEGQALIRDVRENYGLEEGSDMFKEEVIVKALTARGMDQLNKLKTESRFAKVINNILYAIKQALRKVFGKVPVSGLTADTTMGDLVEMLVQDGGMEIDTELVSQDDVVAYNKDRTNFVDELARVDENEINVLINRIYDISGNHINKLLSDENYDALADLLTDVDKRGDLDEMKSNLQAYQTTISNMAVKTQGDMEQIRKKSTALVNTMFRLEIVMEKVLLHVKDIKKAGESQDNLHKAYYYDHLISHWEQFIAEANETLDNEDEFPIRSDVRELLGRISTSIRQSKKDINDMYTVGARDALYDQLLPMHQSIKIRYDTMIKNLRDKGAPQKRIDRFYSEYHGVTEAEHKRLKQLQHMDKQGPLSPQNNNELISLQKKANKGVNITREKIEELLKGNIGDANFFNSYLEGYLYNTDPVVGGLASYVKSNLNDVMATVQNKVNIFSKEMMPLLEDAGWNPSRIGKLGEEVGFEDHVAKKEDDGTLTMRKVWTFLNPFKNYRFDYDDHKNTVEKAQFEYQRTGTEADKKIMVNAIAARQVFMRDYFHQQYVPEFYEREALFEKDQIGKDALFMRKEWGERLRALTEPANTQSEQLAISSEVDLMWREYRQMRSMYYMNGKPKTGHDLDVAKRIREYHDASQKFYENKPRKGVFQNALKAYEQELTDQNIKGAEFKALRNTWLSNNTVKTPKQSWYDWRNGLYERQAEIYKKLQKSERELLDESRIMDEIFDLTGGFKDEEGQTKATEMSPRRRARVKELEEELEVLRANSVKRNGLTAAQNARFSELHDIRVDGSNWTPGLAKELNSLHELKDKYGLTKAESRELENIKTQLAGISKRDATDYYVDTMNNWLDTLDLTGIDISHITKGTADFVLDNDVLNKLLGQNKDFDKWFKDNHIEKEAYNKVTEQVEPKWVRSTIWSVTVPTEAEHFESTEILDEKGVAVEIVPGKPIMKYFSRVVKPEYSNDKIVGVTVDNKYKWLPKTMAQGAKDNKYVNEKYEAMRENDPKKFKVLEKLKEHHLRNQEGLGYKGRLYLDYPRNRKSTLETWQSSNPLTIYANRVKDWLRGAKDDAASGFNNVDQENLVRMDMFDNEITDVPIHGLYDVDSSDVSTDITTTMMEYMLSAERQKQLVKISPIARAVQSVVSAEANKENKKDSKGFEFINRFNFFNRGIKTYEKIKGDSVRKKAIDNFLAREFEGQRMTGAGSDVPWLNNTASLLFKRASFGFFAFNIPSALKNSYGAKFQGLIEASAGKYMTHTSFQRGNARSYKTMAELSFGGQLYKKGPKSLDQQIVQLIDPSQDRFEEQVGEGMSRTIAKDVAGMSWLYNFRKWVELQATLQISFGMMYHQKVEQTINGETKEIAYADAWELRDEQIQLKEGIDPKWGVTYAEDGTAKMGAELNRFKNTTHQVMNNLQGAYAKFDQPEAQRYLVFRFLSYLRRYFTTMTLNRFGFSGRWSDPKPRLNVGVGDLQTGFYITFIRLVKDTIVELGSNLQYMTPEEKQASLKMITEVGSLLAINLAMALLFGWDPDDDDKYEKLRQRSGALPFPMTSDDPDREFNGWGFIENHMLYLLMNVRAENEQFMPLPGYGLDDYTAMLDLKSIAFGPTIQTYKDIFEDALDILEGDESAYYKRKVGPYNWQQEGGGKIWAHIGRTLGLTGSALDPSKGIKGFQSVQARAR
jgi:hypothetical protein